MAEINIVVRGAGETIKELFKFSDKLGDRVTKLALRNAANFMKKRMKLAAPKITGRLRRAIVVRASKLNTRRKRGVIGVYITVKAGKTRRDNNGAYYAGFVEHGHKAGSGKVAGSNFVRNTFNKTKRTAVRLMVENIESSGKQLANKARRRGN